MKSPVLLALLFLLLSLAGCSGQPNVLTTTQKSGNGRQLPFATLSVRNGLSPTASVPASAIPPGTLLTVRIGSAISSATTQPGEAFDAVVDDPVVVQGQTLVPAGAKALGKVFAAKPSGGPQDPGYLRLALTSISINDQPVPLRTSSIFVKGNAREPQGSVLLPTAAGHDSSKKDVKFPADWRLTFRLTQPLALPE